MDGGVQDAPLAWNGRGRGLAAAQAMTHTPVSVKSTPPEKEAHGEISLKSTKSEAGEQRLLLCCKAKTRKRSLLFTDTGTYAYCQKARAT